MGTDVRLVLTADGCGRLDEVLANLGRKDYYGDEPKHYELHESDAAIEIAQLKMYAHFLLGWKPDTIEQAQEAMLYVEQLMEEYADKLIKYGHRMLLAQILNHAGEKLKLEDC